MSTNGQGWKRAYNFCSAILKGEEVCLQRMVTGMKHDFITMNLQANIKA